MSKKAESPTANRRLAAILAADVVGYSRLMGISETGTLESLRAHRNELIDGKIGDHVGRIVKLTGDGMLVEFPSVVNAVACAVEIQRGMIFRNAEIQRDERIEFRIGVHLGDILAEGDDIFGDGVNVAARIESIAKPGGVCISGSVRDNVGSRLDLIFTDRGAQKFKNIDRLVPVYDVVLEGSFDGQTHTDSDSTERCSIAVLPFANMSGDPEQEYFSDGITEDIITNLSRISAVGVIARNTSFQFKNQNVDVPQIARQLNVQYILEGSVRKAGGRVRITAQLIDGVSGEHIWAERYDRELSDVFAVQDEISETIVDVLKLKLLPEDKASIEGRAKTDPQTYKLFLLARHFSVMGSMRHKSIIVRICRRALELDPDYAPAWALLAITSSIQRLAGLHSDIDDLEAAERAIALDPTLPDAHAAKGRALAEGGRYDEAMAALENAFRLDPESYDANVSAARCAIGQSRLPDAIGYLEKAAQVYPTDFWALGMAVNMNAALGDRKAAEGAAHRVLKRIEKVIVAEPDHGAALSWGVISLFVLGEIERAMEWAERAILMEPDNANMTYNIACAMVRAGQIDSGLDLLDPLIATWTAQGLRWIKVDPDLDPVRDHPRFISILGGIEARLANEASPDPLEGE
jgi:adenylate cyclase